MKILIGPDVGSYVFSPTLKTLTLVGLSPISLEQVLLITNINTNNVIYQFNRIGYGGVISSNVITFDFDTTLMSGSDRLQVFIEYQDLKLIQLQELNSKFTESTQTVTSLAAFSGSGAVAAGASYIHFKTGSTFTGTINGVARSANQAYPFSASSLKALPAIPYVVTNGQVQIDVII